MKTQLAWIFFCLTFAASIVVYQKVHSLFNTAVMVFLGSGLFIASIKMAFEDISDK